jgi:hypothetical protein
MLVALLLTLLAEPPPDPAAPEAGHLALDVIIVNDPELPPVGDKEARAILDEAHATVSQKLGFGGLTFTVKATKSLGEFLNQHAPVGNACLANFEATRVRPGKRRAQDVSAKTVLPFLQRWKVDELRAFFTREDAKELTSYDAIATKLLLEFDRKIDLIKSMNLKEGRSLLADDVIDQRSYVRWVCAMREQDEADLVLTNAFILYDLASEPYPHSVFQKCKVGGASLLSPKRRAMRGRAMVGSTFSMTTSLPFFQEEGIEDLRDKERYEVIGSFIVAHELGHALFKLPDFYDHPKECLMTTKFETGYVSGYWYLKAYPGACSSCVPWVEAKRQVFIADEARQGKELDKAIAALGLAIKKTPKHVDGSYKRYIADLSYEIAELHAQKGASAEAGRWVQAVLKVAPDHSAAALLRDQLAKESKPAAAANQ